MKYQISAKLVFKCNTDPDTSIQEIIDNFELSFTTPDGCSIKLIDDEFVVTEDVYHE
jgi:hypothetical protein